MGNCEDQSPQQMCIRDRSGAANQGKKQRAQNTGCREKGIANIPVSYTHLHAPVAWLLHDAGLYVSVVNAMLVHDYGNNSLRRGKTDKKDAVKLANYGLDHWLTLPRYVPEEDARLMRCV